MKNKKLILLLSIILTLVLGACSSPATTESPVAQPEEPAEPVDEAVVEEEPMAEGETAPEDVTITLWTDDAYYDAVAGLADAALEEYGVTLVVEKLVFNDLLQQFQLAAPAGEGPDIVMHGHDTLGEMVNNGLVVPLNLGDLESQYAPAALSAWQYNGEQYGLPINTENVGFFINTDVVPECLATWTEVMEVSREISADNDENIETNKYGFVRMEGDPYHFYPILTAFGGYVFGMTDEGYNPDDIGLDSEGALAAAKFWDEYIKEGLQPAGVDGETMMTMFESGQSAMTITGPWYTQRVIDSGINFKICPIPGEAIELGQPFMGSYGYVVSAFSDDPSLVEIFIKDFLASEESMQALYNGVPNVPANLAVLANIDDPYLAAYGVAGETAQPMPAIPEMTAVWAAFNNAVKLVSQQGDDPVHAFTTAAEQIRTAIAEGE